MCLFICYNTYGDSMNILKTNDITRDEFFKIKEEDVMFITNPGRMGDVTGSTFIVKKDNEYIPYRISGWMYGESTISFEEALNQFPEWKNAWDNWNNEDYDGKYVYIYMGFGNGLSIDKSIYDKYEPYLLEEVNKIKEESNEDEIAPSMYFQAWPMAYIRMIDDIKKDN